jgi:hypothetical protein
MAGKAAAAKVAPAAPRTNCRRLMDWKPRSGGVMSGVETTVSIVAEAEADLLFIFLLLIGSWLGGSSCRWI